MKCIVTELLEELNNSNLPILDKQVNVAANNGISIGAISAGDKIVMSKEAVNGATVIGLMQTKGWESYAETTPNQSIRYVASGWPWEFTFAQDHSNVFICVDAGTATLSYHIVRAEE